MSWKIAAVKIWSVYFKQSRTTVVKNIRNISESYLGLCRTCENSKRLKDINYFCKKNFIIGVWQGPKYASEDFFF